MRRADYQLGCTDCGPTCTFGILLWYQDNEERSRRLATLDTHGRLPTSDLAVEMTLALLETAVTTQCTLAFGEGPDS